MCTEKYLMMTAFCGPSWIYSAGLSNIVSMVVREAWRYILGIGTLDPTITKQAVIIYINISPEFEGALIWKVTRVHIKLFLTTATLACTLYGVYSDHLLLQAFYCCMCKKIHTSFEELWVLIPDWQLLATLGGVIVLIRTWLIWSCWTVVRSIISLEFFLHYKHF